MKKVLLFILVIFIPSFVLGIHNATLYQPRHGFDGAGHVFYIEYIYKNWKLPPPRLNWETHQPPLYYAVGAGLMTVTKTWKTAQYINTFVLWLIIGMIGLGLLRIFKKIDQALIGMLSLAALPMLNIFPAMITNELLNTFWIISCAVSILYMLGEKKHKKIILYFVWFTVSFVLGVLTKVSIFTVAPLATIGFLLLFLRSGHTKRFLFSSTLLIVVIITTFYYPIFRWSLSGPSNIINVSTKVKTTWPQDFFYRLDWIPKIDMYNTQYYSLIGGAWNSFWTDGHNAITPFIKFHKKSFVLWTLGFILLPLCVYGLRNLWKKNRTAGLIIALLGLEMLTLYVYYNISANHYSAVRLTYQMGIVLPYSFGIAAATLNKKLKKLVVVLLIIQFATMVSFFWIQPWWHVVK